jgi:RNA polymerase sigma-70 factor (ECF subfamily)
MKTKFNEEDILELLRNPETQREGFAQVVEEYSERMYWQIRKMVYSHEDANDILQDVFIKAWLNIDKFRGDAKLSTWLYKIAINESITFINRSKAKLNLSIDDSDSFLINQLEGDEYFDGDSAQLLLQKAVVSLPEKQRLVFQMKYFDELKYDEISEMLGTSVGGLKASYHHAVKKVEKFLKESN